MIFLWLAAIFFVVGCFEFGLFQMLIITVLVGIFTVLCAIRDELRDRPRG